MRWYSAIATLMLTIIPFGATASAGIVVSSVTRNVRAAVTGGTADTSNQSTLAGVYSDTATSNGVLLGTYSGVASQNSTTPALLGLAITGTGHADGSATSVSFSGYSVLADSVMNITFSVDANGLYDFSTDVDWNRTGTAMTGSSSILLKNATSNVTLTSVARDQITPGSLVNSTQFALTVGNSYQISALSLVERTGVSLADTSAVANWNFSLAPVAVPEVGSLAMLGVATLAAGAVAWRRRRA